MWRSLHSLTSAPSQPTPSGQEDRKQESVLQGTGSQVQQTKEASTFDGLAKVSAEACDQMIGNLKQAKSKVCTPPNPRLMFSHTHP